MIFRLKLGLVAVIILVSLSASSTLAADENPEQGGYSGPADTGIGVNPLAAPSAVPLQQPGTLGSTQPEPTITYPNAMTSPAPNAPYGQTTPPGAGNYGSMGATPGNSSNPAG